MENKYQRLQKQSQTQLGRECLGRHCDQIKFLETDILKHFTLMREKCPLGIPTDVIRKVDACVAVNADLRKIINERLSELEPFDSEQQVKQLKNLKKTSYAESVFSSISETSFSSTHSRISEKMADAAADLAAKQAKFQLLEREETQRANLALLERETKEMIDAHQREKERIEAHGEVEIAQARFHAYSQAVKEEQQEDKVNTYQALPNTRPYPNTSAFFTSAPFDSGPKLSPTAQPFQPRVFNTTHQRNADHQTSNEPVVNDNNALAKALAESVNLNRLPVPEPSVFTGDPLQYMEWKTSFEMLIERKGIPPQEKIFYLKKYVGGSARKALEGFLYSGSEAAFDNARKVLKERYGHPFVQQKAFRDRLDKWPRIPGKDPNALRDFSDFLLGCKDAMTQIPNLSVLNDCTENQKLLSKLPDWASVRWNRIVTDKLESSDEYPSFNQFVAFVAKEAKVACNPISSIYAINDNDRKMPREPKVGSNKVKVFATSTSDHTTTQTATSTENKVAYPCVFCEKVGHHIVKCDKFTSLSIDRKRAFVRDTKLCYGCLRKGHVNKDCQRKHICNICKLKHPTCLHEDRPPAKHSLSGSNPSGDVEVKRASTLRVSQNNGQSTSMIVPVWVSSDDSPSHEILTYALLDTQSDTTFILDDTAAALQVRAQPIKLSLSTMTSQHTIIESSRVVGLRVRGFNSTNNNAVSINQAYTRSFIPAERSHISERNTVQDWPHLQLITNDLPPLQSCEIDLLIGYNCPQALAPTKMLMGQENEPYAVQTLLGWSVVGYTKPVSNASVVRGFSCRTSVKELPPCSPRDLITALESDFANDKGDSRKVSQEDIHFLDLMDKNIHQREDTHLEMPLPFKERPVLPDNRHLALVRLKHLKTKFKNNQRYYGHYKKFMDDVLDRGDAELVASNENVGNSWYIPHHGVYHPKKTDKLRVVFDCSARYADSSLNQHLLTGPDLTNGLAGVLCRFRKSPIAIMCDIEKMFHQFLVDEADRDFLRFLWWEHGNIENEPLEYRMRVHLFGAASSPGCANYGLKYLAKKHESEFPLASSFVQHDFYVDDGLTSVETEEEAIQLVNEAQRLCANGSSRTINV